jgi:acetoin:2,6-dichlorophenolindophenol oxidoreductase subunit alpha
MVARIRACELRIQTHVAEHGFGGFWHPGLGQEGVQAGAVAALARDDYLLYAHRGLGYVIAKGMSLSEVFGDLLAKSTGSTGGKGAGIAHFCDPSVGVLGEGGTLGSGFVVGAGVGMSIGLRRSEQVCAIFFGDGAASRGTWHEAALEASVRKLPLVWICENNGWALSHPFRAQSPTENVADRAAAYGIPGVIVDGQDAVAVFEATQQAVVRARAGDGPTLIEAKTIRVRGHYQGDQQHYRDDQTEGDDPDRDPVEILRRRIDADRASELDAKVAAEVDAALEGALGAPRAAVEEIIFSDVYA